MLRGLSCRIRVQGTRGWGLGAGPTPEAILRGREAKLVAAAAAAAVVVSAWDNQIPKSIITGKKNGFKKDDVIKSEYTSG